MNASGVEVIVILDNFYSYKNKNYSIFQQKKIKYFCVSMEICIESKNLLTYANDSINYKFIKVARSNEYS
jgi:hypothetical protein